MEAVRDIKNAYVYISTFRKMDKAYLKELDRSDFYEIYWLKNRMYLIPPFRAYPFDSAGKEGILIAFNKDLLVLEAKEFALNVFRLFSRHGDSSTFFMDKKNAENLDQIAKVLMTEYRSDKKNVMLLRTLIKAFLLKLMANLEQDLISPDMNEKRIYDFLLLLEEHYKIHREVGFYANTLSLSSKRLNQILKEKLGKTIGQLIQERIIIEAKHELFVGKDSVREIAFTLGFEDASYFSRFFRKATSLSPEEYRNHIGLQVGKGKFIIR